MAALAAATLILAGCAGGTLPPLPPPPTSDPTVIAAIPLQSGDSIDVDLNAGTPVPIPTFHFVLSGAGTISLALLDTNIPAIGKTPHELEEIIKALYVPRLYAHISVAVTPGIRFYYVTGQIIQTANSKQPYTGRVTVLGAISAAGGFNDYAARTRVQLTRQDGTIFIEDCKKALKNPKLDLEVLPGDKIYVDKQTLWEAGTGK